MPFVIINRVLEHPDINRVMIDDVKAAFDITNHLLDLGHRNIATITGPRNVRHSRQGWKAACPLAIRSQFRLIRSELPCGRGEGPGQGLTRAAFVAFDRRAVLP